MSEPSNQTPNLTERITDVATKLIFLGGSGSGLVFLFQNEIPKALIAGAIATGAGLLGKIWESFMKPINEGMSSRAEGAGKAVYSGIDQGITQTVATVTNVEKQYLEALKVDCYRIDLEGYQLDQALALEDVFVPLRTESTVQKGGSEIWVFLPKRHQSMREQPHRRIVVLASPGYGKTTLLRHLTFTFAARTQRSQEALDFFPIFLRLREIHGLIQEETPIRLPELIAKHLSMKGEFRDLKLSKDWFENKLKQKNCLVMLDGFDEVPKSQRSKVRKWVDQEMKAYKRAQFILTSRPQGFELQPNEPNVPVDIDLKLKVLDFTPDQRQDFITKWYDAIVKRRWSILREENRQKPPEERLSEEAISTKIKQEAADCAQHLSQQLFASPALTDLAKNPLLITMIAEIHRGQTELPKRRVELYGKIFNLLLGTRPSIKQTQLTLTTEQNLAILQVLALNLVQNERTQFTPEEGEAWIQERLTRCSKDKTLEPKQFWEEMRDIAGVLLEKELETFEFAHQTFQEYLAARQIKEDKREDIVLENIENDRWQEIICFYAALGNATTLINSILDKLDNLAITSSGYLYLNKLAFRCRNEGREVDKKVLERLNSFTVIDILLEGIASDLFDEIEVSEAMSKFSFEILIQNFLRINNDTEITKQYITWKEYKLFLQEQEVGQFHSKVAFIDIPFNQLDLPVEGISWEDARWFCAWLSTQVNLQSEDAVYDYRLPTIDELRQFPDRGDLISWTTSPDRPGNALRIVREKLPDRYRELSNYLANGRWQEADQETYKVMLEVAGRTEQRYLDVEDIQKFPCEDLRIIDQLWVKFSGGLFGFSVQKQIYLETGNPLDGKYHKESWEKFCDRVAWRKKERYVEYPSEVIFNTHAPSGHLPWNGIYVYPYGLFSLAETCEL